MSAERAPAEPLSPHVARLAAALAAGGTRYVVRRELGRGGMAIVLLADDVKHGRPVAVKVLHPELATTLSSDRFLREIRHVARLQHPNILPLFDSGEAGGLLYFVMPYVAGESLRDRLGRAEEGRLTVPAALAIAREVADALAYAHAAGLVHRDIKPENVLLSSGHALVADFGIARAVDVGAGGRHATVTQGGFAVGSPAYMSPEQAVSDDAIDGRTDVYSLGVALYEMLVGELPYRADNPMRLLARHALEPIPRVRDRRPDVPASVEAVVTRCLSKDPDDRYADAGTLIEALDAAAADAGAARAGLTPPGGVPGGAPFAAATDARGATPSRSVPTMPRMDTEMASIVVLPFADLSPARDQEYLCDGIAEDIRSALAKLDGTRVVSRLASLVYVGKPVDAREVGRELRVRWVLEGSLQRAADRLRVSVRLTNATDGFQAWSERYDRRMTDVFEVQDEIARTVADALHVTLSGQRRALVARATANPEAYQLYLRGRHFWNRREENGLQKAVECYRRALELDPLYAMPYVGLADAFAAFGTYEFIPPLEAKTRLAAAAERALELDPSLGEAHAVLGIARGHYEYRWAEAEESYRLAIGYAPAYQNGHAWMALLHSATGRHERAIVEARRAQELDPLSPIINGICGWVYYFARQYEAAEQLLRMTMETEPHPVVSLFLGQVYTMLGRYDEALDMFERSREIPTAVRCVGYVYGITGRPEQARAVLARLDDMARRGSPAGWAIAHAVVHLGLGETERALDLFERSYDERPYSLSFAAVEPFYDSIRAHPRFQALLERIGLPRGTPTG